MFELRIMAASSLWQPLIFQRTQTCERWILYEPDVKPDIESFKALWGDNLPLSRFKPESFLITWNSSIEPKLYDY